MKIPDEIIQSMKTEAEKCIKLIDDKVDIRILLRQLQQFSSRIDTATEIVNDPENRFVNFTSYMLRGYVETMYSRKREEWYTMNRNNIEEFYPIIRQYVGALTKAVENRDFAAVISAMKDFFFAFYQHTRLLTQSE